MASLASLWRFAMLVAGGATMQAAGRDVDINSLLQLVVEDVNRNASNASEVNGPLAQDENDPLQHLELLKADKKRVGIIIAAKEAELAETQKDADPNESKLEESDTIAVEREYTDIEGLVAAAVEKEKAGTNKALAARTTPLVGPDVTYLAVGSAGYTYSMSLLAESLESFGIPIRGICFACVDEGCAQFCDKNNYQYTKIPPDVAEFCKGELRCRVSSMKIREVTRLLEAGRSVFFADLDVFFYRHPLAGAPTSADGVDIVIQPDRTPPERGWNFGLFLAYPTKPSVDFFRDMWTEFQRTQMNDQGIFNDFLLRWDQLCKTSAGKANRTCSSSSPMNTAAFDLKLYPALMLMQGKGWGGIVAAHATCIDGPLTKLLAVESSFGVTPARRLKILKTVSTSQPFDGLQLKKSELDRLIAPLIANALETGRAIRLRTEDPHRVFSYDRLHEIGVDVVPEGFWDGRQHIHTTAPPVNTPTTSDELLIEPPSFSATTPESTNGDFTCRLLPQTRLLSTSPDCLRHCDGFQFRLAV